MGYFILKTSSSLESKRLYLPLLVTLEQFVYEYNFVLIPGPLIKINNAKRYHNTN